MFRSQAPAPLPPRPISIPTPRETTLPNGLSLVVVEDKRLPLISYRLAFRVGGAFDPPDLPGLTDLLAGLLPEGTETRTSKEIADEVARMGASLSAGATSDYTIVAASALSQFNDPILALIGRSSARTFVSGKRSCSSPNKIRKRVCDNNEHSRRFSQVRWFRE